MKHLSARSLASTTRPTRFPKTESVWLLLAALVAVVGLAWFSFPSRVKHLEEAPAPGDSRDRLGFRKPSRSAWRPLAALILIAAVALTWWYLEGAAGSGAAPGLASGTIEAEEVSIAAEVGGRVERVAVEEGAGVRAGQVLVEIDSALLQAQAAQARAGIAVARANLALVERGARDEDVRAAEGALAQAVAQRDAARKAWENLRAMRENQQDLAVQIDTARSQLEIAQARLDQVNKGANAAEVAAAEAAVQSARAAMAQAEAAAEAEEKVAAANLEVAQARLDALLAGSTPEQIAEAEAAVRAARNQLYAAQSQGDAYLGSLLVARGQAIYTADMKEAQAGVAYEQLTVAEARLAQLKAPPRGETVRQAEATVAEAQAQLAALRQTRARTLEAARANLSAAEAWLQRVKEGATDEERRLARAAVTQAERQLQNLLAIRDHPLALIAQIDAAEGQYLAAVGVVQAAQARLDALRAGPTLEQVAVARAHVSQAEAALGVLEAQVAKMTLRAPADGTVTRRLVRTGETASPGMLLLTTANLDTVSLVVYVAENRIGRVRLSQPVEVSVDSFPGETFAGEVSYISSQAEFTPRNVQSQRERANTVFAVKVRIPNPDRRLKPGMPADARLEL